LKEKAKKKKRQEKPAEWVVQKRWNPFNSYKLLAHVHRWKMIRRGKPIPPPVLITVDPTNVCNFNCLWCNAAVVREQRKTSLSERALTAIADFLPRWGGFEGPGKPKVEAICVAGGGEPLLNPHTGPFIERVIQHGIEVGVVTNGSMIHRNMDTLSHCTWIGVSVDAGTEKTFNKLKRLEENKNLFQETITNIANLVDYAKLHNNRLGLKHPAYGVSYKYLLHKDNIPEVYEAARLAKEIGCKNIHFRPAGVTWNDIGADGPQLFSEQDISLFEEQIKMAMALDDDSFNVYGITHKFNSQFGIANTFMRCHAVFMTSVIMPRSGLKASEDAFTLGLCCDRRGDDKLELMRDMVDTEEINRLWGSEKHWRIHDRIRIRQECPRCTYQPHNEIFEQVILNDSMTYKFI
jgi:MoaA/NifB/PqqE/SkfB family radical SAM enzyme